MKIKTNKKSMGYYSTLLQKYRVDDSFLQNRKQKRAIGNILEKIDNNSLEEDTKLDKDSCKRLRNAFGKKWFNNLAAGLTFAMAISLFQAPSLHANTPSSIASEKSVYSSLGIDEDSSLSFENKAEVKEIINTTSLHFISNKTLANEYKVLENNTMLLDDDSDISVMPENESNILTVIDSTIEDSDILAKSVEEGAVLLLQKDDNALDMIIAELKRIGKIDSLNIISHGSSGQLHFNDKVISSKTINNNSAKWEELGKYLNKDADILLYGCNVASGEKGKSFIQELASLTNADIAASINPSGNTENGGDWRLEVAVGEVNSDFTFGDVIVKFPHVLADGQTKKYNFLDFNLSGSTLTNADFNVTNEVNGSAISFEKNTDYGYAYINNTDMEDKNVTVKITANSIGKKSFELNDLKFYHYFGPGITKNLQVIGHKVDGTGTISSGITEDNDVTTTKIFNKSAFPSWSNFSGAQLDYFTINFINVYNNQGASTLNNVGFYDFTIKNNIPSASNFTFGNSIGNQAMTFNWKELANASDKDGDSISISSKTNGLKGDISVNGDEVTYTPKVAMTGSDDFNLTISDGLDSKVITVTVNGIDTVSKIVDSGVVFASQPTVYAVDEYGNIDTDYTGSITLSEDGNGSLVGTNTASATAGIANFSGLKYNASIDNETFKLTASDNSLTDGVSNSITAGIVAKKLIFATEPSPTSFKVDSNTTFTTAPIVKAVDDNNMTDTDFTQSVIISENGTGSGIFSNNSVIAVAGVATFSNLSLQHDTIETMKLKADGNNSSNVALTSGLSTNITINPNQAPNLTSFTSSVSSGNEDTSYIEIDLNKLNTQGDEADSDGTIVAYVVQSVVSGSLKIGTDYNSATAFAPNTNDTIDSSKKAFWTPVANANGSLDAFSVKVKDNDGSLSSTAITAKVQVNAVNDVPTANDLNLTINEDNNQTFGQAELVAINYQDEENTPIAFLHITSLPNKGVLKLRDVNVTQNQALVITDAGFLVYHPESNGNGTPYTSFNFKVDDGDANSTEHTITINVNPVNDAPELGTILSQNKNEDFLPYTIDLNGTDVDSSSLTYAAKSNDTSLVDVNISGNTLSLKPVANASGNTTIDVNVTDGNLTSTKSFNLTVNAINDAPVIDTNFNDLVINEDNGTRKLDVNISDIESEDLNLTIESNNTNIIKVSPNYTNLVQQATYANQVLDFNLTTVENANGVARITLILKDNNETVSKSFDVNVSAVNDAPNTQDKNITINEDNNHTFSQNDFNFTDIDTNDSLEKIYITNLPTKGSLKLNGNDVSLNQEINKNSISNLVFSPSLNENDTPYTTFDFKVNDGEANSTSKTITLNVNPVDDAPNLSDINATVTNEDTNISINLDLNDIDSNTSNVSYVATSSNTDIATVSIVNGKVVVSPKENANGVISVEVNATLDGKTVSKTFDLNITAVNDAPNINTNFNDLVINEDNGTRKIDVNISDIDGDDLNLTIESNNTNIIKVNPSWNSLIKQATYNNQVLDFNLTTVENANGIVRITLNANDGDKNITKTFDVDVSAVNDAPTANDLNITIDEDTNKTFSLAQLNDLNFSDVDNDSLSKIYITSLPSNGKLEINGTSVLINQGLSKEDFTNLVYTPNANGEGLSYDSFNFVVNDGDSNSTSKSVTFNVTAVNDSPSFSKDSITIDLIENNSLVNIFNASDIDSGDNLTYTTNANSDFFELNSTTGELKIIHDEVLDYESGKPNDYNITITVTDSNGAKDTIDLVLNIKDINEKPEVISTPITKATEDRKYEYLLLGQDDDPLDEINWTVNVNHPLPSWLELTSEGKYIRRFAGVAPFAGEDSNASYAQLNDPSGMDIDKDGNLYFADRGNHVVRKVDTNGVVTTFAGIPGKAGYSGNGEASFFAELNYPYDVKIDSDGNFFITSGRYIKKVGTDGIMSTFASLDGSIYSLYIDEKDNIFATTTAFNIYKIDRNKNVIKVAGDGSEYKKIDYDGSDRYRYLNVYDANETNATQARFYYPQDSVTDKEGNIYIADSNNHLIRKVDANGTISIFAGVYTDQDSDHADIDFNSAYGNTGDGGKATEAKIYYPRALAFDSNGSLLFSSQDRIRKVDSNGTISTVKTGEYGISEIKIDKNDNIFIAYTSDYVKKLSSDYKTLTTITGIGSNIGIDNTEGLGLNTKLNNPNGIVVDSSRNVYVTSYNKIHKIAPNGQISNYSTSLSGRINKMDIDKDNNIYYTTSSYRVEKVSPDGNVTVIAGTGSRGSRESEALNGDGGLAKDATFYYLEGIKVSDSGEVYVVDQYTHKVRKIDLNGTITTFAGTGEQDSNYSGSYNGDDINATSATLNYPTDVDIDSKGNVYILDSSNSRIRKVDTNGVISTFSVSVSGYGLHIDEKDTVYSTDYTRVYKFDENGTKETIAGDGNYGYYNDNGLANKARFYAIYDLTVDNRGAFYLTDRNNGVVRKMFNSSALVGVPTNDDLNGNISEDYNITLDLKSGKDTVQHSFIIKVNNSNDIPTSMDENKTLLEDSSITLSSNDIHFEDVDPTDDALSKVRIKNLPTKGKLYLDVNSNNSIDDNETIVYNQELTSNEMNSLKYIPNANGFGNSYDNFSFLVNDGKVYSNEYKILFNVTGVNDDETGTVKVSQDFNVTEDQYVDLNYTYSDVDLDTLSVSIKKSPTNGTLNITNSNIKYTPKANYFGEDDFILTYSDSEYSTDYSFKANVIAVDDPANFEDISNKIVVEDNNISIDLNYTDIDNNTSNVSYVASSSNTDIATVSIVDGKVVVTPKENANGIVTIEVNATLDGNTISKDFNLTIEADNDVPFINTNFNNVSMKEDNGTTSYDVNISDIEGSDLNLTVESNNTNIIKVSPSWNSLIKQATYNNQVLDFNLTTVENANGIVRITLNANDGDKNITKIFDVNVSAVNDAPILQSISNQTKNEDFTSYSIDLNGSDIDSSSLTYSAKSNNTDLVNVTVNGNVLTLSPVANANGSTTIDLNVSDGELVDTKSFDINVSAVNDAPVIDTNLSNITTKEDSASNRIELSSSDIENQTITYSADSNNTDIATVRVVKDGDKNILVVSPVANANGVVTITVTSSDGNKTDTKTFEYVIDSVNDAPKIENISDIALEQNADSVQNDTITFNVSDDGGVHNLNFATPTKAGSLDLNVSNVVNNLDGTATIDYSIPQNATGTARVSLKVNDGNLSYEESFNISVKAASDNLCVEDTKTALTFDTIKGNNKSQDFIEHNLSLANNLTNLCNSEISWKSSDTTVLNNAGEIVSKTETEQTVQFKATITKGKYTSNKEFLLTIVANSISDSEAIENLTFQQIRNKNQRRDEIVSDLNLISLISGKNLSWSSDNTAVIDPYTGVVTRESNDVNVSLKALIESNSSIFKEFNLTVLAIPSDNLEKLNKDMNWLNFGRILGDNIDNDNIITNLIKPLPSTAPNGSTISWTSSNTEVVTTEGDVFRSDVENKVVVLTATISNGDETPKTKDFILTVLQNAVEDNNNSVEFNRVDDKNGTLSVVFKENNSTDEVNTSASFDTNLNSFVEKVVSNNFVKSIVELKNKVLNLFLNTDGTAQSQIESTDENNNSVVSKVEVETTKSSTKVDENGTSTTVPLNDKNTTIKANLNSNGSVSHEVEHKDSNSTKTTRASSTVAGSDVKVDSKGIVTTSAENKVKIDGNEWTIRAIVQTNTDGTSTTRFEKVNLTTGSVQALSNTVKSTTPFEAGNKATISKDENGTIYIETETSLGTINIVIE